MANERNQNQNQNQDRNQQNENNRDLNQNQQRTAGRNEDQRTTNEPLETQGGGGARGYETEREQNEVNREREELNSPTTPQRENDGGMSSPGRQSDEQR